MDLPLDTIKHIVDLADVDSVYLTGGEPFTHPEIKEIIHYFLSNGKKVSIATNGLLLSEEMLCYLDNKNISLLVSLRERYKEVFGIINQILLHNIDVVCYHLPSDTSPDLLLELIRQCPSLKEIKLLYNSKDSPTSSAWLTLLSKIYKKIRDVKADINVMVEIGFLPKQNPIALEKKRGAFDRIHISSEGRFFGCPLLVESGKGTPCVPPQKCTPEQCPVLARKLDDEKFTSVCCFLITSLENAVLLAKWGEIL
jgi:hypothetical protein